MKLFKFLIIIFAIVSFFSCSKSDDTSQDPAQQLANVSSNICPQIKGVKGLYWDIFNGVARGDIPGGIPTLANPGAQFIHSGYPALGFTMPAGYFAVELSDQATQTIGVNVLRNDQKSIWRYVNTTFNAIVTAEQILQNEMDTFTGILGTQGDRRIICTGGGSQPQPGATLSNASVLFETGNSTAYINVNVYASQSLGSSFIGIQVAGGPTAEIENEILNTYLPIGWQLLYTGDTVVDSDGDGVPDITDNFPFDPNKQ